MEDLKKTLRDFEAAKAETLELLDNLLEKLGESLISRLESSGGGPENGFASPVAEGQSPPLLWEEKKRLQKEIVDSEGSIKAIEADLRRLGELEEEISRREREKNEKAKEIGPVYMDLGRHVLTSPGFSQFSESFEQEKNNIELKISAQQKRLDDLDNAEGGIFNRLSSSVKGLLVKGQLSKSETALEKFYQSAGERFLVYLENTPTQALSPEDSGLMEEGEIAVLARKGGELRKLQAYLKDEIGRLRTERRKTADTIDQTGNPTRRISELEVYITRTKDEIRRVYRSFGACARENEWKDAFSSFYSEADRILDDKIVSLMDSLHITERKIESTRTAIAVENEKTEIVKLKDAIADKRRRIADAETAIAGMETQIAVAEKRIETLMEKNGEDN